MYGLQIARYFKYVKLFMWTLIGTLVVSVPNVLFFHGAGGRYSDGSGVDARPSSLAATVDRKREWAEYSLGHLLRPDNLTTYEYPFNPLGMWADSLDEKQGSLAVVVTAVLAALVLVATAVYMLFIVRDMDSRTS